MLNLLSSGVNIQLHDTPTLESKFSFGRPSVPQGTLFISPHENVIVSTYNDNRIDLLTVYKSDNGSGKIKRIQKFKLDGVTCGKVMFKNGKHEIAMGLTNGTIEFVDFNVKKIVDRKFSSDAFGNTVMDIDFNKDFNLLASTYESGEVQLFDVTKNLKLHRHKLDLRSDLVRFHPTNPDLLAVTSLIGALSVLNVNIKRSIYSNANAHKLYSKAVCWSPVSPSVIMSAGNDCYLKVFDMRKSLTVSQTKHKYPYSALAVSNCGTFCCAGDMKGSIMLYDLRNMNNVLHFNNSHEGSDVKKLLFLPTSLATDTSVDGPETVTDSEVDRNEVNEHPRTTLESVHLAKAARQNSSRKSIDAFFDTVAPRAINKDMQIDVQMETLHMVQEENHNESSTLNSGRRQSSSRKSIDIFFDKVAPRSVNKEMQDLQTETLLTVQEENGNHESSNSNEEVVMKVIQSPNSVEDEVFEITGSNKSNLSNSSNRMGKKRLTVLRSNTSGTLDNVMAKESDICNGSNFYGKDNIHLPISASLHLNSSDNNHNYGEALFPQKKVNFIGVASNADLAGELNEIYEKVQNLENQLGSVNERMLNMERKIDSKLDDLSAQMRHGFLSIHSCVWALGESDIAEIKSMVSTIHGNYRNIEDIFIENTILKKQLNDFKSSQKMEE